MKNSNKVGRPLGSGDGHICHPCFSAPYYLLRQINAKVFTEPMKLCNKCLRFGVENRIIAEYRKIEKQQ